LTVRRVSYEIKYYSESVVMLQHSFSKANLLSLTLFPHVVVVVVAVVVVMRGGNRKGRGKVVLCAP